MTYFLSILIVLTSNYAIAKNSDLKSWKTFQSDYGFEIKYPDNCWEIGSDDIAGEGPLSRHTGIVVLKTDKCMDRETIAADITFTPIPKIMNKQKMQDMADDFESRTQYTLRNGSWFAFKKFKTPDNHDAIAFAEQIPSGIRWQHRFFCDSRVFVSRTTTVNHPPKELLAKLKKGDMAIPEPQKKIFESFRCIEPKIKTDRAAPLTE